MLKKLLMFAITSGLAATLLRKVLARDQGVRRGTDAKAAVAGWEAEGGRGSATDTPPRS